MPSEPHRTLKLFNEKAAKLDSLSFTEYVRHQRVGFSAQSHEGIFTIEGHGPSTEAVDAFVLTLRFFVQDNEPTSLRRVAGLYADLPLPSDLVQAVQDGRQSLNAFLDSWSQIALAGERLSNREIFEVFLWGGLAHANEARKAVYDKWAARTDLFIILQTTFHGILIVLLRFIFWLAGRNTVALAHLEDNPAAGGV